MISNSGLWYTCKKNETIYPHKNLHMIAHSNIIHNSQKLKQTQMSTSGQMDKQNMVYLYNGLWLSCKKKGSTDTCFNMDEPWKHDTKWKKLVTKDHI